MVISSLTFPISRTDAIYVSMKKQRIASISKKTDLYIIIRLL